MKDLVIIGSGPAGLAAAIYARRAELDFVVLEKAPMSGGQIVDTYEVDNYPGLPGMNGFDLAMAFRGHADKLGAAFESAEVTAIEKKEDGTFLVVTDKDNYETKTIILAMGASHAQLGVPGEDSLRGSGVSYCATCDGAFFRDKTAIVIGGGDVALEDALFLARGCSKVYLVHRRDELRGTMILQKQVKENDKIEILWDSVLTEIEGSAKVEKARIKNVKTGDEKEVETDAVFIAVGIVPATDFVKDFVKVDAKGFIEAGEDMATSVPGVFAAGDIRTKRLRQVITA
ncbi:MAG: thioredoxin-disulfide reductase, partial [Lachnospiraceae bacterium]|nr:thioredoxin-disulfide reductase [Lachnospiraceae bacterium]